MKKQLLTTTALVAAGVLAFSGAALAADGPSLKISGSFAQGVGFQDVDGGESRIMHDENGEIHFTASMKLDNGITVRAQSQVEADSPGIDETRMSISGSFGQIAMGQRDGAMYAMTYGYMGHTSTGAGNLNLEFDGDLTANSAYNGRGLPRLTNDDRVLVYFTPRISGLQAGISYAHNNATGYKGAQTDIVSTAVNYNGKFGDAGVRAAVGYATGNNATGDDTVVIGGGVSVSVGGFTGAAGVVQHNNGQNMDDEVHTRSDVGLRYKFGPNSVRVGYLQNSDDDAVDLTGTIATFARSLGPGVMWSLDAVMTEDKNKDVSGSYVGSSIQIKF